MKFISYAQNFEDVMLWRALKHVEQGFYIDVGAWWPDIDSVTKAFYDAGWRGINIEPGSCYIADYDVKREQDINLRLALSDKQGEAKIHVVSDTGLSSLDQEIVDDYSSEGMQVTAEAVEITTLERVCEQYCVDLEIHFLKVDVEGLEESVLKGGNWQRFRPWIVVIESTLPRSRVESFELWEPVLTDADYVMAYADGLNRFYVAAEHDELIPAFRYPPNVFDDFTFASEVALEARAEQAELALDRVDLALNQLNQAFNKANQRIEQLNQRVATDKTHIAHITNELVQRDQQIQLLHQSLSWRLTLPLRWLGIKLRHLLRVSREERLSLIPKILLQKGAVKTMAFLESRPAIKQKLVKFLIMTGLFSILKRLYHRFLPQPQQAPLVTLTPYAKMIHNKLLSATNRIKKI